MLNFNLDAKENIISLYAENCERCSSIRKQDDVSAVEGAFETRIVEGRISDAPQPCPKTP